MKKSLKKREAEKPRRLTLSRETIKLLEDPALLELARGGQATGEQTTTVNGDMCG